MCFGLRYFKSFSLQWENLFSAWYGTWQPWETFNAKGDGPFLHLQRDLSLGMQQKNRNVFCSNLMTSQYPWLVHRNGATNMTAWKNRVACKQPAVLAVKTRLGHCWSFKKQYFFRSVTFQSSESRERADDYTKILVYLCSWICVLHLQKTFNKHKNPHRWDPLTSQKRGGTKRLLASTLEDVLTDLCSAWMLACHKKTSQLLVAHH